MGQLSGATSPESVPLRRLLEFVKLMETEGYLLSRRHIRPFGRPPTGFMHCCSLLLFTNFSIFLSITESCSSSQIFRFLSSQSPARTQAKLAQSLQACFCKREPLGKGHGRGRGTNARGIIGLLAAPVQGLMHSCSRSLQLFTGFPCS
mmetsp:Transcript_50142/g.92571  ORF Transcript_50142/g.92571 Transcript_50142/m.92571 type:complete len:148 (+) Transcript_50142:2341-2784(+)